jgi:O-antigen/teichoic acid export membrane protein
LLPAAVTVVLFAPEVLSVWLGTTAYIGTTAMLLQVLAGAAALQGLLYVPNALMLGSGSTRLPIAFNLVGVVVLVPLILVLAGRFGALGAAGAWLTYNLGYVLVGIPVMHRQLLPGHALHWYVIDVGAPLAGALIPAALIRVGLGVPESRVGMLALILAALVASAIGATLLAPSSQSFVKAWGRRLAQRADTVIDR